MRIGTNGYFSKLALLITCYIFVKSLNIIETYIWLPIQFS